MAEDVKQVELPAEAVQLCEIEKSKYFTVPAKGLVPAKLVEQDESGKNIELNAAVRPDYPQIVAAIKASSAQCVAINAAVVARIRERYSVDDEIMMLRIAPSVESAAWNDYVEECRSWGREQKAELGL